MTFLLENTRNIIPQMRLNHFKNLSFLKNQTIKSYDRLRAQSFRTVTEEDTLKHHWCSPSTFADEIIEMYAAIDDKPNS